MSGERATVVRGALAPAPVICAARLLGALGAQERIVSDRSARLLVHVPGGDGGEARLDAWEGEEALAAALDDPSLLPTGAVLTAYASLRLAAAALAAGPEVLSPDGLIAELLAARALGGESRGEVVRCRDGWVVARWRDDDERELFRALVADPADTPVDDVVATARTAALLVGAVRPPRPPRRWRPDRPIPLSVPPLLRARQVVDWTVLWAGPWAAQRLHADGASVERVEHPRRRDGLLASAAGCAWWDELNGGKRLSLVDARDPDEHAHLERSIADADVLLTSMTPRALASLGFDDGWRRRHAPSLLHLELVAFDEPWESAPGLGEHAAAEAGLLWRGGDAPARPYPWPDALLGAAALLIARTGLAGRRIRLSLESVASLAFGLVPERPASAAAARRPVPAPPAPRAGRGERTPLPAPSSGR